MTTKAILTAALAAAILLVGGPAWAQNTWEEYTALDNGYLVTVHVGIASGSDQETDRNIVDVSADGCTNQFRLTYAKICVEDAASTLQLEWDESTDDIFLYQKRSAADDDVCTVLDLRASVERGGPGVQALTTNPTDILFTTAAVSVANAKLLVHVEGLCR